MSLRKFCGNTAIGVTVDVSDAEVGRGCRSRGGGKAATCQDLPMTAPITDITPEFQRGWDAALVAARDWHASQAKKTLIQARRSKFPKNLEREAEVHQRSAEMIVNLSPHDV